MSFEIDLPKILETYYEEYKRPLKYFDPRNVSKTGGYNLLDEHNQTINFCNAVRKYYFNDDVVSWFELSIGKNLSQKKDGKDSTNAIDGIVYIPSEKILLIVESKGLRRKTKFEAINVDLKRTIGIERKSKIEDYKLQLNELHEIESVYAITLADIWGGKEYEEHQNEWNINFSENGGVILEGKRTDCEKLFDEYKAMVEKNSTGSVKWWSSKTFKIGDVSPNYRLLVMVYKMSIEEIETYNIIPKRFL